MLRNITNRWAVLLLIVFILAIPSYGARYVKPLADGVTFIQDIKTDPKAPLVINILKVHPQKSEVNVVSALGQDKIIDDSPTKGREALSSIVARKGALAGVNADFFPFTGDPLGLQIRNGELISEPMDRAAVGITADGIAVFDKVGFDGTITSASGEQFPLRGLNRQRGKNELVLFTQVYGTSTGANEGIELPIAIDRPIKINTDITATVIGAPCAVNSPIPAGGALLSAHGRPAEWIVQNLKQGDKITIRFDIKSGFGKNWDNVKEAVGGGPMLVRGGNIYVDASDQKFQPSFSATRHPRTAIGGTASGELLLVTVDGRQQISRGMTLNELAELMKSLGAVEAINLDGGGSSAFSIKGIVNNSPSEGKERLIANGILVYSELKKNTPTPALRFCEEGPVEMVCGEGRRIEIIDESTGQPAAKEVRNNIIWGTTGGIGFVNQDGWFIPLKTGKGAVVALIGEKRAELPVIVVPGKPAKLTAKIVPDPTGAPNLGQVVVKLTDANGNGIAGKEVTITITGGMPDSRYKTTDAKGSAVFIVTWDSTKDNAKVKVSSAGLTAEAK